MRCVGLTARACIFVRVRVCVCAARTAFADEHVTQLEQWIDRLDDQLPPLTKFILPVRAAVWRA